MAGSLEEALLSVSNTYTPSERIKFVVDNDLRTITKVGTGVFGVYNDRNVQVIDWEMPRYYHDLDRGDFGARINYVTGAYPDIYLVQDYTVGTDKITFTWTVGHSAFLYNSGEVTFSLCLRKLDSNSIVLKEFNTTIYTVKILKGLEVDMDPADEDVVHDYLTQIAQIASTVNTQKNEVTSMRNEVSTMKDLTNTYKNSASDSATAANGYANSAREYRDQAAAIVTPEGLAARVLALEDLGFSRDSDDYLVQEADD